MGNLWTISDVQPVDEAGEQRLESLQRERLIIQVVMLSINVSAEIGIVYLSVLKRNTTRFSSAMQSFGGERGLYGRRMCGYYA